MGFNGKPTAVAFNAAVKTGAWVFAGNYHEFQLYMERGRIPPDSKYIAQHNQLLGLDDKIEVIRVGTWYKRQDLVQIEETLAVIGAQTVAIETTFMKVVKVEPQDEDEKRVKRLVTL